MHCKVGREGEMEGWREGKRGRGRVRGSEGEGGRRREKGEGILISE